MAASDNKTTLLIYGAYGYTGRLCCEEAHKKDLNVVVGGVCCTCQFDDLIYANLDYRETRRRLKKLPLHTAGLTSCAMRKGYKKP